MELKTLGCHGGESPRHRSPAFLLDNRLAVDAGAITGMLDLEEQSAIEAVILSHAHLDHVRDLAVLADARAQGGGPPLQIISTSGTIRNLRRHYFNDKIWPDYSVIPASETPTIVFRSIRPEKKVEICGFTVTPVRVNHTVEAVGYIIDNGKTSIAYSGDTGPTDRLFEAIKAQDNLSAFLMEVAFPNSQEKLARIAGHHTPNMLEQSLKKIGNKRDLPVMLFHIKPVFEKEVERELGRSKRNNLSVLRLGDRFLL
jgi:3',5'-cyclic-nucleotide phosphodiesterase